MDISFGSLVELLLRAATLADDDTAQHVLMAVKRMDLSSVQAEVLLAAVADGLGVSLV